MPRARVMEHSLPTNNSIASPHETDSRQWLRCPLCKGQLDFSASGYHCAACCRDFPVVLGIPDLRVYPDPYLNFEDDRRKGQVLQARAETADFAELVRFYWEITPETPANLKGRFIHHVLSDDARAESILARLPAPFSPAASCLEVGCGTGAFAKAATRKFRTVVGCDIAFRWLVVARKRLAVSGAPACLVCCCADYLPFPRDAFDSVVAISLLEHVQNPQPVLDDCARVLRDRGSFLVLSTNRYSLATEPHVGVWGVGFLPRRWMQAYVRWKKGVSYDKHRLPSYFELRRFLRNAGFEAVSFSLPQVSAADREGRRRFERAGGRLFNFLGRLPLLRRLIVAVSPLLQASARKKAEAPQTTKRASSASREGSV